MLNEQMRHNPHQSTSKAPADNSSQVMVTLHLMIYDLNYNFHSLIFPNCQDHLNGEGSPTIALTSVLS